MKKMIILLSALCLDAFAQAGTTSIIKKPEWDIKAPNLHGTVLINGEETKGVYVTFRNALGAVETATTDTNGLYEINEFWCLPIIQYDISYKADSWSKKETMFPSLDRKRYGWLDEYDLDMAEQYFKDYWKDLWADPDKYCEVWSEFCKKIGEGITFNMDFNLSTEPTQVSFTPIKINLRTIDEVKIFNIKGQQVAVLNSVKLTDLKNLSLPSGIYFAQFNQQTHQFLIK
jgi:hypothetical protein